jgi:hypothetical protein
MTDVVYISEVDEVEWFCEKCGAVMPEDYFVMVDDDPYCPEHVPA